MEQRYVMSVGFSKRKGFNLISRLISLVEGTEFSHAFVTWKCTNINRRKVYEAVGSGSRKISNNRFKEKAFVTDIFEFEVGLEDLFKIDQFTHDEAGTPYGYKHLVGIAIMRICNAFNRLFKTGKKCTNPFKDGKYSQICVEAGAKVVELAKKIDMPGDIEDYGLREFYDFVSTHGQRLPQERIDRINQSPE